MRVRLRKSDVFDDWYVLTVDGEDTCPQVEGTAEEWLGIIEAAQAMGGQVGGKRATIRCEQVILWSPSNARPGEFIRATTLEVAALVADLEVK